MSEQTLDNLIYQINSTDSVKSVPYLKKEWNWTSDATSVGGDYSINQLEFNTTSFSANGEYCSYREGFLVFPVLFGLTGVAPGAGGAVIDFSNDNLFADCCLAFKNSYHQLIHSCQVFYSNGQVVQQQAYLNNFVSFVHNTTFNEEEIQAVGDLIGFYPDTSDSWGYNTTKDVEGKGIYNNVNAHIPYNSIYQSSSSAVNEGLIKRGKVFDNTQGNANKNLVLGDSTALNGNAFEKGINRIEKSADSMCFHAYAIVRLKDLCSFFANMPMTMGAVTRIALVMNHNIEFKFTMEANGVIEMVANSFQNPSSITNPLMVCAHSTKIKAPVPPAPTITLNGAHGAVSNVDPAVTATYAQNAPSIGDLTVYSGSYSLPLGTYTVRMGLAKLTLAGTTYNHKLTRCRLYLPSYVFNPDFEKQYVARPIRSIKYTDFYYSNFTAKSGEQFQQRVSASVARARRLILVATLPSSSNEGVHSLTSPFYDNCSNCVPFTIRNFEVLVANKNLYTNMMVYTYEQMVREIGTAGSIYGLNGGEVCGANAGLIDLKAYNNNRKYIVVNLERTLDEMTGVSLEVRGDLTSPKDIQFFCYIQCARDISIDVQNGNVVA